MPSGLDAALKIDLSRYHRILDTGNFIQIHGKVSEIVGLIVEGHGPAVSLGEVCAIYTAGREKPVTAEVVGFRKGKVLLMPLDTIQGLSPGCRIVSLGRQASVGIGPQCLGRVLDGLGQPIDDQGPVTPEVTYPIYADPINPLKRGRITEPIDLGIKAINGVLTCGKGQRMGIFAGSGVGKSVLLGMIARNTQADVNVIGLIGERGREVREFLEKSLGREGLERSVVVVAASDRHPLIRMRAAYVATTIAEYFRDQGKDVLLMVDSLTRFAMAQREIGLSVGEPPTTKGYTPSVFSLLPKLLERSGKLEGKGSITGLYTILVEGDDFNEPIADAARSILDGHVTLTRELANAGHYPAVDVLQSISRVMIDVVDKEQLQMAGRIQNIIATYKKAEDLINIGAYVKGSNAEIDYAVSMIDGVNEFLRQGINEKVDLARTKRLMQDLFRGR
ncbi:MAG TPA: flagellar protein export ATPase FliI [Syntrophales bacterium]|nr:flagellar protein export ATPase FliI [Syntrophales bacterium]HOM07611.1 flagellar protein export ATPase FliI [Syntrophales bacterium]HON99431.1 flagellar protein export ATPase FliI [Syntrophales bacterium]HPC00533.1 flagellar protein export ATPase FliI [Syntrophales bacterium]HPQ06704.1 flagellar protein export ATPase FliI [Syntrophales bacterium]